MKEFALEAENQSHSCACLHPKIKALTRGAQNTFPEAVYSLASYGKIKKLPLLGLSLEQSIPSLLLKASCDVGSCRLK